MMRKRWLYRTAAVAAVLFAWVPVTAAPAHASVGYPAMADLNGRASASLNGEIVKSNMYLSGQTVNVICQARGDMAYGSDIWDWTTDYVWVTDAYVRTGVNGFTSALPRCNDVSRDIHSFPAMTNLAGRVSPSLSAYNAVPNAYLNGEKVPVVCQASGGSAYGSTIWDFTADNLWVTDYYVNTGSNTWASGVPRCTDAAPTKWHFPAMVALAGRTSTSTSATEAKTYAAGSTVTITCQTIGTNAYGSNIWDKTIDNLWVADHYLDTGYDTFVPGIPRCSSSPTPSSSGSQYTISTALAGRNGKSTSATEIKTYAANTTITVTCQAYGEYAYGTAIWDKTTDGLWVTDYYVMTGTNGFVSGMPRCDDDSPTGAPAPSGCPTGHGRIDGPAGSTAGTTSEKIERVISAAAGQTGKNLSYSWGGGGRGGPSCGSGAISPSGYNDYNVYGFDCSGYTEYAYWAGAGIDIGTYVGAQLNHTQAVPWSNRQRGDLVIWFNSSGATTHVAIYLGNDQILEAAPPRGTGSVHQTSVYGTHAYAYRVF